MRALVLGAALWLTAAVCSAATPFDGKWKAEAGNEKLTFTLATADNGKVTGSVATEGQGEAMIEWGFVKSDLIVFRVKRVFQGSPQPFIYIGKIDGSQIAFGRRPEDLSLGQLRELSASKAQ